MVRRVENQLKQIKESLIDYAISLAYRLIRIQGANRKHASALWNLKHGIIDQRLLYLQEKDENPIQ